MEVESTKKQSLNLPRLPVPPQGHINIRGGDRTSTTLPPTGFKPVLSAYFNTRIWHGVLYWLSPFTKGNDPLRQSHVRVTTLLFCLYFQKSFHSSNNAPIYAMYTYINHCKESSMTIFLIIGLQYPWRRNWDSNPPSSTYVAILSNRRSGKFSLEKMKSVLLLGSHDYGQNSDRS